MNDSGFHPVRLLKRVRARLRPQPDQLDLKAVNVALVDRLKRAMPHDQAMEAAIGGGFELYGAIQSALLTHYGLPADGYLIDVGCGSGRLAKRLRDRHTGGYLGVDLVPALVANARRLAARPDWRFEVIDHIGIPEADGRADMVCFFSVFTHLLHEQSYWYLEEARRVLKPGGRVLFSFLEFTEPVHFDIFLDTVRQAKARARDPLNVFIDREAIVLWARQLGLDVVEIRSGRDEVVPEGNHGQATCVLQKPV